MSIPEVPLTLVLAAGSSESHWATPDVPMQEAVRVAGTHRLEGLFSRMAQERRTAPAITTPEGSWSYARLHLAARLIAHRIAADPRFVPGERVILMLPNSAEYVAAFYGVLLAGGVVVPVPARTETGALDKIISATEPILLIADRKFARTRADSGNHAIEFLDLTSRSLGGGSMSHLTQSGSGSELAAIFFTAGSTGSPKGVMLSHNNLISNARSIQEFLGIGPGDRPLCVLPFPHAFGNSVLQSHVLAGAQLVLGGNTAFPQTIIEALAQFGCTSLSGVPDLFRVLLDRSSLGQTRLPELRYMAVAGGALRRELALEAARRIDPAEFVVMYGQTEATARLAYVPPALLPMVPAGCIGQAVPGVALEVVDERGFPVPSGNTGELRAAGPSIMLGYWRDEVATRERIRNGWLYTGDLATVDAQGLVIIQGRRNSLVKIAGFRVQPTDLEDFALRRLPIVQAVAVPFETDGIGTRLALYVVPDHSRSRLTVASAIARCRAELPRHMVPDHVEIVAEFPLNPVLKIDRPLLARLAEQNSSRRRATG